MLALLEASYIKGVVFAVMGHPGFAAAAMFTGAVALGFRYRRR